MGEEKKAKGKKKKGGGEKKPEEEKKVEVEKKVEDEKAAAAAATEEKAAAAAKKEKPKEEEKKPEGGGDGDGDGGEKKDGKDDAPPPPPPPPPEIVLRVFMHCEGCARKVRKCLKGFDGVVDVTTDCKTHKVVVTGEKADPLKVLDRLQKKTHRQVDLLSPIPPPPPPEDPNKPEQKEAPKPEDKKEEPKVVTVVLQVHMHCDACSLEIKRRIERMKEVEEAIPDLKSSQVTVKGTFDPPKLVEYVYKRTGKHATIVKEDPPPEKKEDTKEKDGNEEKKDGNGDEKGKKGEEKGEEEQKAAEDGKTEDGKADEGGGPATAEEGAKVVELKTNEFQYYPPRYAMEMHAYPPQIFSDENPNACSIM